MVVLRSFQRAKAGGGMCRVGVAVVAAILRAEKSMPGWWQTLVRLSASCWVYCLSAWPVAWP